ACRFLHDALPISRSSVGTATAANTRWSAGTGTRRSTPSSRAPARSSDWWSRAPSPARSCADRRAPAWGADCRPRRRREGRMRDIPFVLATMARRGLLRPGPPLRVARQLGALWTWGYGLAGELRSAAARDSKALAVIDEHVELTYGQLLERSERLARALR